MNLPFLLKVDCHYRMSTIFVIFSKKPDFCIKRITKRQSVFIKGKTVFGHKNVDTIPLFSDNLGTIKTGDGKVACKVH